MSYYNQRDYGTVPYPAEGYEQATLKSAGCGVCCGSMLAEKLTGERLPPEELAKIALEGGARVPGGTDMGRLGRLLCSGLGLSMTVSADPEDLKKCLDLAGAVICNVSGSRPGHRGIFSTGGHYVLAVGMEGDRVKIWDPDLYPGKFRKPGRTGVELRDREALVSPEALHADCLGRNPRYYCFHRAAEAAAPWAAEAWQKCCNRGLLDGTGPDLPVTRQQLAVVLERLGMA